MPNIKDGILTEFFNTSHVQYAIPPYQRTITWPADQWEALINDIFEIIDDQSKSHLIQMFQLQGDDTATKYIVGDGQQRLVHTSLIFIALAYAVKEISDHHSVQNENSYRLKAFYEKILPDKNSRLGAMLSFFNGEQRKTKIIVGPSNRATYETLISWDYNSLPNENAEKCIIQHAFEFYRRKIAVFLLDNLSENSGLVTKTGTIDSSQNIYGDISEITNRANALLDTMSRRLVFAAAYFKSREEMQASYENTNSRSVALTESELIKNNIFKRFDPLTKQEELVQNYWNYFDNNYWIYKDLGDKNLYDSKSQRRPDSDKLDDLFYYHLTAVMGQYGAFVKKEHHATFKAFKSFYEKQSAEALANELSRREKIADSSPFIKADFISDYYENLLRIIKSQGELFRGLEEGAFVNSDNIFKKRAQDFYYRVIDACNLKAAISILFVLDQKITVYKEYNDILNLIESFVIRKALSSNTVSAVTIYKLIFKHLNKEIISCQEMKNELSKETNKLSCWEGNSEIIKHQMKKMWKSNEHALAALLITDFENSSNNISNGLTPRHLYRFHEPSIEHFMPQNPIKNSDWPLVNEETGVRDRLTFNFGNLFVLPSVINGKLGNRSLKDKKAILATHANQNQSLGYVSLDYAYKSNTWDKKNIENSLKYRLDAILKKYDGPQSTATKFEGTPLLKDGIVDVNENIYYFNSRLEEFSVTVHEDGSFFYNHFSYKTFAELMKTIDPLNKNKNYLDIWTKNVAADQYMALSKCHSGIIHPNSKTI
jgi:hypothetical protein